MTKYCVKCLDFYLFYAFLKTQLAQNLKHLMEHLRQLNQLKDIRLQIDADINLQNSNVIASKKDNI